MDLCGSDMMMPYCGEIGIPRAKNFDISKIVIFELKVDLALLLA